MRLHGVALGLLMLVGGMACSQNGGAQGQGPKAAAVSPADTVGGVKAESDAAMTIPKDAQFTVYCATIQGADHVSRAKALRGQLLKSTGMRDWYMIHGEGQTTLYYGFYGSEKDPKAQEDRKAVARLQAANGDRLFQMVCLMPLETADSSPMAQWNLENAKGVYSLEIAVYRDNPRRKEAAEEAVKEARASGIEAYYYHGNSGSVVCVGAWPETAVRETTEIKAADPHEVVGVGPTSADDLTTTDGRHVRMVKPTYDVLDPTLRAVKEKYPILLVNGKEQRQMKNPRTDEVRTVITPSAVVRIPRKVAGRAPMAGEMGPDVTVAEPGAGVRPESAQKPAKTAPPVQPGGKLKSIGD